MLNRESLLLNSYQVALMEHKAGHSTEIIQGHTGIFAPSSAHVQNLHWSVCLVIYIRETFGYVNIYFLPPFMLMMVSVYFAF